MIRHIQDGRDIFTLRLALDLIVSYPHSLCLIVHKKSLDVDMDFIRYELVKVLLDGEA